MYFKIKDFINYPPSINFNLIQITLTWIIPIAFINYYPSLFLLEKEIWIF
ncbi:ABC-2 family transporter protein [Pseudogracilibacillus sp. SE30717A]